MDRLYERLGGKDAITAVVDDFVARCAADERINGKFARTDIGRLKRMRGVATDAGRARATSSPTSSSTP